MHSPDRRRLVAVVVVTVTMAMAGAIGCAGLAGATGGEARSGAVAVEPVRSSAEDRPGTQTVVGTDTPTANDSEPLRILAGDDSDPDRSVSTHTVWSVENGTLRSRTRKREPSTYLLDGVPPSSATVAELARETDGARTSLLRPVVVPVADDWQPVASAPVSDVRVIARSPPGATESNRTTSDRRVAVRHDRHGHWLPVRNATVRYADGAYVIENPSVATVNVGTYVNYTQRLRAGQRALLRTADDPSRVTVARTNGTPIANASAGGGVPTRWAGGGGAAIRDHWAHVTRASPGAFDGDRLIVGDGPVRLFVPGDFTGHVPSAWSRSESCGPDGRTRRRWEHWSIEDVDRTVSVDGRRATEVAPGVYRVGPPFAETIAVEHTARLRVHHEWGVDDDCGSDTQESNTSWITHTVERSVPVARIGSENLSVTAFVVDRPDQPLEVHYHVAGNRGLVSGGLGSVTLSVDEARHTWRTPWAFYPVRTHDEIVQRWRNGTTERADATSFAVDARVPTVYRDRVEPERRVVTANDLGFVPTVETEGAATSNRSLGPTVRTAQAAESLLRHYGGTISQVSKPTVDDGRVDLTARDLLGQPVQSQVSHRQFQPTSFTHRIGNRTVATRLTSDGLGLDGRTLTLQGTRRPEAETNATGWVRVRPTNPVIGVSFAGSPYRPDRAAYYAAGRSSVTVARMLNRPTWTVSRALFATVSGTTAVSGWLAIGWFLRWQRRRRPGR
jgi:hypothetical protein